MGAGYALEAALNDSRVRGLILIGPPRSGNGAKQEKVTDWARTRFSADRGLNEPVESHLFAAIGKQMDIAEFAKGVLSRPGHKPILLIDGEKEGASEKIFLRNVASEISPPLKYVTLPAAGHYMGVYNLFGSRRVYYRPDLFDPFMKVFNEFTSGIPLTGEKND
jgi:pimeloyl-ACP methyl ester carboxylesterase